MNKFERLRAFREAGRVQRCHTVPHRGEYSVAEHSWQVALLLLVLHPNPSPALLREALLHDVAERWTGDVPAPAKWASPDLAKALRTLEGQIGGTSYGLALANLVASLSEEERWWLHGCDLLELHLWCLDQRDGEGNKNVQQVLLNIEVWFSQHAEQVPRAVLLFYRDYKWERGSDNIWALLDE